jgi:P27 family predicted phage terminase small subunit
LDREQQVTSVPGPRPVPTHLRLLRGSKRPIGRGEPQPPRPPEPPEPPGFIVGYALDEWWRLAGELHVLGLLTVIDVMPFAAYCQAYARWRTAEEALMRMADKDPITGALLIRSSVGDARCDPLVRIANNAAADMIISALSSGSRLRLACAFAPASHGAMVAAASSMGCSAAEAP